IARHQLAAETLQGLTRELVHLMPRKRWEEWHAGKQSAHQLSIRCSIPTRPWSHSQKRCARARDVDPVRWMQGGFARFLLGDLAPGINTPPDHQGHDGRRRVMLAAPAIDPQPRRNAPEVGEGGDRRVGRPGRMWRRQSPYLS